MSKMFEALSRARQENPDLNSDLPLPTRAEEQLKSAAVDAVGDPAVLAGQAGADIKGAPVSAGNGGAQCAPIPIRLSENAPVLPYDGSNPYISEQYRIIRTKLIQHPRDPRVLLISSPGPSDGKTVTAVNLAGALALRDTESVALVDADLRRPGVASVLGLPVSPGLADVLAGACSLDDAFIQVEQLPNLYVLPAGDAKVNPTELLDGGRWRSVCEALQRRFRFTVVDATPIIGIADYALVQAHVDGVVIVVRPDHTDRALCMNALETVPKEKLIGLTINCAIEWPRRRAKKHDHYYYYGAAGNKDSSRRGTFGAKR